jgi:hypothetical protein
VLSFNLKFSKIQSSKSKFYLLSFASETEGAKMKVTTMALLMAFVALSYSTAQGFTNLSDCFVTNDIGKFTYRVKNARLGNACGVVGGADHFDIDHADTLCDGGYSNINEVRGLAKEEKFKKLLSIKVQVTQHTGGDSDRWLLHEADAEFRTYYGIPDDAYMMRQISSSNIITDGTGGWTCRWLSSNKVINIEYTDLQGNKPEPLEVVQAYLAKFPSTLSAVTSADLRTSDNQIKWIKDEIERRLWLCDKWNAQFQAGKTTQADLLYNLHRSMGVFLNYRHKYYGVSTADELAVELITLRSYMDKNDLTSMLNKLTECKTWWTKHKEKRISLP